MVIWFSITIRRNGTTTSTVYERNNRRIEKRAYVERYTWFSFGTDDINGGKTALYNQKTGQLTQLGKLYKQLGNPHMNVNYEDQYIEDTAYYGQLDALI